MLRKNATYKKSTLWNWIGTEPVAAAMRKFHSPAALAALSLAALPLAGCGRDAPAPAPAAAPASETPQPVPSAATAPSPGAALPPADAPFRYEGLWAVDTKACADPPWRFEARRLATKGEVSCAFDEVTPIPAGYRIAATCTAEGPPLPHTLTLTFAESAKAMLVEGGPFSGPIGLVWCGPRS
jgi:hypothetical protein